MSFIDRSKTLLRKLARKQIRARDTGTYSIDPDDVFLCSYPRSGNTWVRYLIAYSLVPEMEWDVVTLQSIVPDLHLTLSQLHEGAKPRVMKTHFMPGRRYPRVIYLVRDGRDMCVSYYHYFTKLYGYRPEFTKFVRELCLGYIWPGPWHVHVNEWMEQAEDQPFLFVRYEDLLVNPQRELGRILGFIGLEVSSGQIELAIKRSSLEKNWMKFRAIKQFRQLGFNGGVSGRSGGWNGTFSDELNLFFLEKAGSAMELCGYTGSREKGGDVNRD